MTFLGSAGEISLRKMRSVWSGVVDFDFEGARLGTVEVSRSGVESGADIGPC